MAAVCMAYDNYTMAPISGKQYWLAEAYDKGYKFIFYHDVVYRMI